MTVRPRTVVFDVIGTLMDLEPLRGRFADIGLEPGLLEHWIDRLHRNAMALPAGQRQLDRPAAEFLAQPLQPQHGPLVGLHPLEHPQHRLPPGQDTARDGRRTQIQQRGRGADSGQPR